MVSSEALTRGRCRPMQTEATLYVVVMSTVTETPTRGL